MPNECLDNCRPRSIINNANKMFDVVFERAHAPELIEASVQCVSKKIAVY